MGMSNKNNNREYKDNVNVYSRLSYTNLEDKYDNSKLTCDFWGGNMKLKISPRIEGDVISYDKDNGITIYLSPFMAKNLASSIRLFLQDINKYNNIGIVTKRGIVLISNGIKELGHINPLIKISTLDENLKPISSFAHVFKPTYSIRNFNEETGDFDKINNSLIGLDLFCTTLEDFARASGGASAYVNIDRFINGGFGKKMLGKSNNSDYSAYNKFNKKESTETESYSVGDLDELFN